MCIGVGTTNTNHLPPLDAKTEYTGDDVHGLVLPSNRAAPFKGHVAREGDAWESVDNGMD